MFARALMAREVRSNANQIELSHRVYARMPSLQMQAHRLFLTRERVPFRAIAVYRGEVLNVRVATVEAVRRYVLATAFTATALAPAEQPIQSTQEPLHLWMPA